MLNFRVGKQRVVGRVRPVHGDDVGQPPGPVDAVEIGPDPHAFGRVDIVGGMPDIRDRDFLRLGSGALQADRYRARRCVGHRKALAAEWLLGRGREDQRTEEGKGNSKGSQHGMNPSAATAAGGTVSPNSRAVMMTFAHSRTPDLLHLRAVVPYCEMPTRERALTETAAACVACAIVETPGTAAPGRCRRSQHCLLRGGTGRWPGRDADARLSLRHSRLCRRRAATGRAGLPRHRSLSARLRPDPVSRHRDAALGRAGGHGRRHDGADGCAWHQARGIRGL